MAVRHGGSSPLGWVALPSHRASISALDATHLLAVRSVGGWVAQEARARERRCRGIWSEKKRNPAQPLTRPLGTAEAAVAERWARPHWPSVTCAAACVSDTARRLPAHCEIIGPEVRSFYSVSDKTCLLAGAEQEGLAHNPWSTHGPHPVAGSDPS